MLTDGVVFLHEVDPAQAQHLAKGVCPLPSVHDYPHSDAQATARLARDSFTLDNWVPGFGMHLILRCQDHLVVGDVGFRAPPDERGVLEICYGLAASARGKGLATRAVRLLCAAALARPGVSSIMAETGHDNPASRAVLLRCGFSAIRSTGPNLRFRLSR